MGTFALLGFPPFGSFMAEMLILSGIVQAGNLIAFTLMCTMLTIIFVATGPRDLPDAVGARRSSSVRRCAKAGLTAVPKLGFVTVLVLLGVYTPAPISQLLVAGGAIDRRAVMASRRAALVMALTRELAPSSLHELGRGLRRPARRGRAACHPVRPHDTGEEVVVTALAAGRPAPALRVLRASRAGAANTTRR